MLFFRLADSQGNLAIAGTTSAPDFPLVSPLLTNTTTLAAFVTKLDPQLHIVFSSRVSGTQGRLTTGGAAASTPVALLRVGAGGYRQVTGGGVGG